jgi:hypothetical protein
MNAAGRQVGYLHDAECDYHGCTTGIDLGLAYVCGGEVDGGELGCGGYFCPSHLCFGLRDAEVVDGVFVPELGTPQLCPACLTDWECAHLGVGA